jgi:hypothetical protein
VKRVWRWLTAISFGVALGALAYGVTKLNLELPKDSRPFGNVDPRTVAPIVAALGAAGSNLYLLTTRGTK